MTTKKKDKERDIILETLDMFGASLVKVKLAREDIFTEYAMPIWKAFDSMDSVLRKDGDELMKPAEVLLDFITSEIQYDLDCSEDEALDVAALSLAVYALSSELEGGNEDSDSDA